MSEGWKDWFNEIYEHRLSDILGDNHSDILRLRDAEIKGLCEILKEFREEGEGYSAIIKLNKTQSLENASMSLEVSIKEGGDIYTVSHELEIDVSNFSLEDLPYEIKEFDPQFLKQHKVEHDGRARYDLPFTKIKGRNKEYFLLSFKSGSRLDFMQQFMNDLADLKISNIENKRYTQSFANNGEIVERPELTAENPSPL